MKNKTFSIPIELKADSDQSGEFRAVFSTFNVIDHDRDVTVPGAFKDGQEVRISYWGHRWSDLPVGKGVIHQDDKEAWVDGKFFLDTVSGLETYKTVKNLGKLQQWSYGYDILEATDGVFEESDVQFLNQLEVYEVSPVLLGAGIDTRTTDIKGQKPYPNEHACRLRNPSAFQANSFRRVTRDHEGKKYDVIMGKLTGETTMTEQAYRYPKDVWTAAAAKSHCSSHDGISFEPASSSGKDDESQDSGPGAEAGDGNASGMTGLAKAKIDLLELEE